MSSTPPKIRPTSAASIRARRRRQRSPFDGLLAGLVLITLLRSGEVLAGEPASAAGGDFKLSLHPALGPVWHPAALAGLPNSFLAPDPPTVGLFPTDSFRPRGRSVLERDTTLRGPAEALFIPGTTVWERLSEYRARDRVRVLTLWETGGNSVSLQADHRGDPSLQWTSRMPGRSSGAHGILDEVFAKSLGALMGKNAHETPRTPLEAAKAP